MKKLVLLILFASCSAISGELVKDASVGAVASNASGASNVTFGIYINGGSGVCSGSRWIFFPESKAPSPASYNQSFSIALAAHAANAKVTIHNYSNDDCSKADFIAINR